MGLCFLLSTFASSFPGLRVFLTFKIVCLERQMSAFFVRKGTLCILLRKETQAEWSGLWVNFNLPYKQSHTMTFLRSGTGRYFGGFIMFCCHSRQSTACRENVVVNELWNETIWNFSLSLNFPELRTLIRVALTSEWKDVAKLNVMLRYVVMVMYFLVNFPFCREVSFGIEMSIRVLSVRSTSFNSFSENDYDHQTCTRLVPFNFLLHVR